MTKPRTFEVLKPVRIGNQRYMPGDTVKELFDRSFVRLVDMGLLRIPEEAAGPAPVAAPATVEIPENLEDMTKADLTALATKLGIEIDQIEGTGANGNVLKEDIKAAIEALD